MVSGDPPQLVTKVVWSLLGLPITWLPKASWPGLMQACGGVPGAGLKGGLGDGCGAGLGEAAGAGTSPPSLISTFWAKSVSANPWLSVSATFSGPPGGGRTKLLCVSQQSLSMSSMKPSASPSGVKVKGLVTATLVAGRGRKL